jgi:hypothetical protein
VVKFTNSDATFCPDCLGEGIDSNTLQKGEVNHKPAVAHRISSGIVTPTSDSNEQIVLLGEVHRCGDISDPSTLDDKRWPSVNHAIPHGSGIVIVGVRGLHQPTSQHFR